MKISDLSLPYMAEDCYLARPLVSRFHFASLARETGGIDMAKLKSTTTRQMTDLS
jgi:hypothetical protein